MNAKKAKALRRAAEQLAAKQKIPAVDEYLINKRTGVIRVGRCFRGLYNHLKKRIEQGSVQLTRQRQK